MTRRRPPTRSLFRPAAGPHPNRRAAVALTTVVIVATLVTARAPESGATPERPRLEELEPVLAGGAYPKAALARDSDGDGWSDWYERLQGTDPYDPFSHPEHARVELEGHTVFVQSTTFPDRLTMVELSLGELGLDGLTLPDGAQRPTLDALDLVATYGGLNPGGKQHAELTATLKELQGNGVLADMLATAAKFHARDGHGTTPFRIPTGLDVSLYADGRVDGYVNGYNVSVGTQGGNPYIQVNDGVNRQIHVRTPDGLFSSVTEITNFFDGTSLTRTTYFKDGKVTGSSKRFWDMNTGEETVTEYDADGNVIGVTHTAPTNGATPSQTVPKGSTPTQPAGSSSGASTTGAAPSSGAGSATAGASPTGEATPSASNTYENPDAEPFSLPTPEEVVARVTFLGGVRARFGSTGVVLDPSKLLRDKPYADPEDPGCDKAGCVVLTEVQEPRLGNVNGGDPVPPDLLPSFVPPNHGG